MLTEELTELGALLMEESTFDMLLLVKLLLSWLVGTEDTELRLLEGETEEGGFPPAIESCELCE